VVVKTDGLLVIRDLATTNGTKVKGQRVRWAALLPDDRIALGAYKLRVYLGPDNVPGPSELARLGRRRPAATAAAVNEVEAPTRARDEFATPSPPEIPIAASNEDDLEILDDDDDESGWRRLIDGKTGGEDVVIELD
jgi:hypothetical protein